MDVPPEIAFRGMEPTDELKDEILDGITKLEEVFDRLVSCRVMVENATPARHSGMVYRVRIELGVPGRSVVVDRDPPTEDRARGVVSAVREAFEIARRRLRDLKERWRDDQLPAGGPAAGRVVRLLEEDDQSRYGFLMAADGRQIYFREDALQGVGFDELEVGAEVTFLEAEGTSDPHASTVAPLAH